MGLVDDLLAASPTVTQFEQGARWSEGFRAGGQEAVDATLDLITTFSQGEVDPDLLASYSPGARRYAQIWDKVIDAAEAYNEPGKFTTFIGFEWTSLVKGNNLHRNVILRDGGDRARQVLPFTTEKPAGSTDPLDLYKWLEAYESETNGSAIAFAHNGNLSNGLMFPVDEQYTGRVLDETYWIDRNKRVRFRIPIAFRVCESAGCAKASPSPYPAAIVSDCAASSRTPRARRSTSGARVLSC